MKYMLLMSSTRAEFDSYVNWPKEDLADSVAFMRSFAHCNNIKGDPAIRVFCPSDAVNFNDILITRALCFHAELFRRIFRHPFR